jgi:hypothetical protein
MACLIFKYIKYLIFHTREIYLNTQDSFLAIHFHLTKPCLGSCQIAFHSRIFLTFVEFHLYYCKTICYYDLFCLVILGSPWIWTYDSWFLGHHGCGHNDSWLLGHHGCGHMIVEFGVTMGKIIWLLNLWSPWATSYNCWICGHHGQDHMTVGFTSLFYDHSLLQLKSVSYSPVCTEI